jgi:hypothetical protein
MASGKTEKNIEKLEVAARKICCEDERERNWIHSVHFGLGV